MAVAWVSKIPRADKPTESILLHTLRKKGSPDLDLTLLATEGEVPYKAKSMKLIEAFPRDSTDDDGQSGRGRSKTCVGVIAGLMMSGPRFSIMSSFQGRMRKFRKTRKKD